MGEVDKQLYKASFRGVPFLIESSDMEGGRRLADHDYPNKDTRFLEDMGKIIPDFSIEAIIYGGSDYFQKRDRFIEVLNQKGPGQLSHPFFGNMTVAVRNFKLSESTSSLGKASFSITFAVTGKKEIYPQNLASNSVLILAKVETLVEQVQTKLSNNFQTAMPSPGFNPEFKPNRANQIFNVGIQDDLLSKFLNITSKIQSFITSTEVGISRVKSIISNVKSNSHKIVSDSDQFSNNFVSVFQNIDALDVDSEISYNGWLSAFKSDINKPLPKITTVQSLRNFDNQLLVSGCFNILALAYAYQEATNIDYVLSDQLTQIQEDLEEQYQYILAIPNVDYDLLNAVQDIRTDAISFFRTTSNQVYKVTPIHTNTVPLAVLTYQYYGNLDNQDQLSLLNNITEPSFVSGDVSILTT